MINLANCPFTVGLESLPLTDRYSRAVNVKDFGAKGDGTTDDWQAITNAIAAAFPSVGLLHFPAGHYMISKSLVLRDVNGGIVSGDGAASTRITFNGPLVVNGRHILDSRSPIGYIAVDAVFDTDGMQTAGMQDLTLEMPYSTDQTLVTTLALCLNVDRWDAEGSTHGNTYMDMIFIGGDMSVGLAANVANVSSILGSEMAFIHCKFIAPTWHAIKAFSQNSLSHHAWFCHFLNCGTTPTVPGQNTYATIEVSRGSMVAAMFCTFEDSKDCDILVATAPTYMIACHHRSTQPKNIDNGPSMWIGGGGVRGQGLTFENTTADDTMIFRKGSANVLDVCDFKTGYAGDGEDYMMSSYKACTFGKVNPFTNTGRNTVFVDDQFLKGPGTLTPLVTGAPILSAPTFSVGA